MRADDSVGCYRFAVRPVTKDARAPDVQTAPRSSPRRRSAIVHRLHEGDRERHGRPNVTTQGIFADTRATVPSLGPAYI